LILGKVHHQDIFNSLPNLHQRNVAQNHT
jgi:hypothetical protein